MLKNITLFIASHWMPNGHLIMGIMDPAREHEIHGKAAAVNTKHMVTMICQMVILSWG